MRRWRRIRRQAWVAPCGLTLAFHKVRGKDQVKTKRFGAVACQARQHLGSQACQEREQRTEPRNKLRIHACAHGGCRRRDLTAYIVSTSMEKASAKLANDQGRKTPASTRFLTLEGASC